ncbi:PepSY domain-containing protein [Marinobacterium stanieri]|uniref:PepSY domain-containing protein n=1 Tax=Marinobacterium stanieri TaxID=49186 RepID=UPI0002559931|nr:PepSY domain-containing protein [Marinobacterium stanieri]
MKTLLTSLLLSTAVIASPAFAGDKCDVPKDEWQSEQAFRDAVAAKGWEIKKFKIDDGCYEIYGYDEKDRRVEAYFDPKSFEIVKMELED